MVSDLGYYEKQLAKLRMYYSEGIVPWDNLIISYDNYQGELDLSLIDAEIRTRLIV